MGICPGLRSIGIPNSPRASECRAAEHGSQGEAGEWDAVLEIGSSRNLKTVLEFGIPVRIWEFGDSRGNPKTEGATRKALAILDILQAIWSGPR